ncbi:MAG: hypothetical protein BWY95_00201 [Bacteroidetes bacterium ADurb.BinA104]|nr:MAG: hypothetical protein BWY95_00201 [Bacteroidetes bacterium ADurb.BinA104]
MSQWSPIERKPSDADDQQVEVLKLLVRWLHEQATPPFNSILMFILVLVGTTIAWWKDAVSNDAYGLTLAICAMLFCAVADLKLKP